DVDQIAIVCRDMRTYALPIIATAREFDLPVRLDCEIPIAETELGRFTALIFEIVERRTAEEIASGTGSLRRGFLYGPTLRLMLHRLGPGLSEEQRASIYKALPSSYDAWRSITDEAELVFTPGDRSVRDWTAWFRNLLGRWEIRSKEKLGTSAAEIAAYDRLFRSLEQVAHSSGPAPIHVSVFAADVADVLANVTTPLHTSRGGILVAEPNDMAGCSYEMIFVVGMAEGSLPAVSTDSNVIDLFECDRLREHGIHFQDALEVPRWEALSFYFTLLACRRKVVFSYPKFAVDREQIASSYFKRLGLRPGPDAENYVSSLAEYRRVFLTEPARQNSDEVFTAAVRQFEIEQRRESDKPADEYDGVIGIPIKRSSWSATSLTRFGSCRFKWFASDILRLREPAEAETDLPPRTRGTLLHKTLELAVGRSRGEADLRKAVLEILEAAFAEAEQLDDSLELISNWNLRRAEQVEKLRIAISSKDFIAPGASVIEVEKEFKVEFCGMTITGTIDRIDRLADESILAVDYKHGSTIGKVQDADGYLNVEIQLPLYYLAALPMLYPDHQHAGGQFFHIAEQKLTKAKDINLAEFLERVKLALETGNFAVEPDVKGLACEYCDYDVVCRVGPRLARKSQ
ncbi:MAG TPA: PD-(D/E)XK nuclease family protein, partial [Pyrinomonadaceae bacterium]